MIEGLFAQDPPVAPPGGFGGPMLPFFLLAVMALFWVVVVLPAGRRQKKEQQAMLAAIQRGTRVVTSSGIIGTVVSVKDEEVVLRSEDSRLKVLKSTVLKVLGSDDTEATK